MRIPHPWRRLSVFSPRHAPCPGVSRRMRYNSRMPASPPPAAGAEPVLPPELLLRLTEWRMPFGKYQGRVLADLPLGYLTWFARQGWPPGELGQCLALTYEIKHNGLGALLTPLRKDPSA